MAYTGTIRIAGALLSMWLAQQVSAAPPEEPGATLSFPNSDLLDAYGRAEPPLRAGGGVLTDRRGRRYAVEPGREDGAGCSLVEATGPRRSVGTFGAPADGATGGSCEYLGSSPGRAEGGGWILAGAFGEYCAFELDELARSLERHEAPRCALELPAAANPPGGAPEIVGWLSNQHVILKTAYCCESFRYHFADLEAGRIVGIGMSFDDGPQKNGRYPVLRPWSDSRQDYWLVQRASQAYAEWPATLAVVHCASVVRYLQSGAGALQEIEITQRKVPKGATLMLPETRQPCPSGIGP
jgi:hypothetical protein